VILLISASQVARITGMSHPIPGSLFFLNIKHLKKLLQITATKLVKKTSHLTKNTDFKKIIQETTNLINKE
jgi:hypothetical protein